MFVGIRGAPRLTEMPARGTRTKRGSRGPESMYCWGPAMAGNTVVPCRFAKVLLFVKAAPVLAKKVTAESHFRSCKTLALDSKK